LTAAVLCFLAARAMMVPMQLALTVKERALEIGFDLAGIAPLGVWKDLEFARQWVEKGYGGEMRYLANSKRYDPRRLLPSAKSVICVGLMYNTAYPYSTETETVGSRQKAEGSKRHTCDNGPRGWISRYAWGQDYHEMTRVKLQRLRAAVEQLSPGVETRAYVDTGPIVERAFARYSGMGWMGKNTCLINEAKGSWFFLGILLTSLELEPDLPAPDRCGSCTRCLEACPTGALVEPYVMDASRCISYFTIELQGSIPEQFRSKIGANVFGCDTCQDVCPWNSKSSGQLSVVSGQQAAAEMTLGCQGRKAATTERAEFQPLHVEVASHHLGAREFPPAMDSTSLLPTNSPTESPDGESYSFSLFNPLLESLAALSEDDFRRIFSCSPIKRTKYRGWVRNLCVAIGNSGDRRLVPWLENARKHPDPIVREHAAWARDRLRR